MLSATRRTRRGPKRLNAICFAASAMAIFFGVACDDARTSPPPPSATPTALPTPTPQPRPDSPLETVRELNARRMDGRYDEMAALLLLEQREAVLSIVRAVDELIAAEFAFRVTVQTRLGEGSERYFARRDQVANILGPLSRDVEVLAEVVDGATASVSFQVADRIPVESVDLVNREGKWYVRTDTPIPGLADALRDLASVTRRITSELEQRNFSRDQLAKELDLRHATILRRIADLTKAESQ